MIIRLTWEGEKNEMKKKKYNNGTNYKLINFFCLLI